jgi:histidine triad (HIT) family protein
VPIDIPKPERCPFCSYLGGGREWAVVEELESTLAWLPPRQSGRGHVLVIPKRHAPTLLDLEPDEASAIMHHVRRVAHALSKAFDPAGLNVFQNNGLTAGQTVPHYHVHIVPSYPGDLPGRIFSSGEIERSTHEELLVVAAQIREHLA